MKESLSNGSSISSSFEFKGLKFFIFSSVYAPAEDSFLLAKYSRTASGRVLDVGTGCGIQALVSRGSEVVGVDVNPVALENARFNADANNKNNCVFFDSNLFEKVEGKFDFVLFNPPYLPTSESDKTRNVLLDKALDGGESGRVVVDIFLREFEKFLKPKGKLLLLHSSYAGTGETIRVLKRKGFLVRVLEKKRFPFFEELSVLEASRK
ncbi:methyltransferase [Candidatus Micrarchaeota archaeon]|nr:methyltransferase [Candidatus Micrarchaeota archaeon]